MDSGLCRRLDVIIALLALIAFLLASVVFLVAGLVNGFVVLLLVGVMYGSIGLFWWLYVGRSREHNRTVES